MARANGKSDVDAQELDAAHELPASDNAEDDSTTMESPSSRPGDGGELQKLRTERDTLIDRLARLQAEFENARKRTAREQQDFREYAVSDAVKGLLPTLDSFERALQIGAGDKSEFHSGVELIYKQLQDALQKLGLRAIPAKGEPFDPHLHVAGNRLQRFRVARGVACEARLAIVHVVARVRDHRVRPWRLPLPAYG